MLTTEIDLGPRLLIRTSHEAGPINVLEMRPENGIPLETSGGGDVKAFVDRAKMSQVIHNLVSNGLKFTPSGGHVSVTVTLENESMSPLGYADDPSPSNSAWVKISVTDVGVGLSQENISKLFKSAIQFNPEVLQAGGGSGLGLLN
eukprot:gene36901-biopygen34592